MKQDGTICQETRRAKETSRQEQLLHFLLSWHESRKCFPSQPNVHILLTSIGLPQYEVRFAEAGYEAKDDVENLVDITEDELRTELKIDKLGENEIWLLKWKMINLVGSYTMAMDIEKYFKDSRVGPGGPDWMAMDMNLTRAWHWRWMANQAKKDSDGSRDRSMHLTIA